MKQAELPLLSSWKLPWASSAAFDVLVIVLVKWAVYLWRSLWGCSDTDTINFFDPQGSVLFLIERTYGFSKTWLLHTLCVWALLLCVTCLKVMSIHDLGMWTGHPVLRTFLHPFFFSLLLLCGYLKDVVYITQQATLKYLKHCTTQEIENIARNTLQRVICWASDSSSVCSVTKTIWKA